MAQTNSPTNRNEKSHLAKVYNRVLGTWNSRVVAYSN